MFIYHILASFSKILNLKVITKKTMRIESNACFAISSEFEKAASEKTTIIRPFALISLPSFLC